MRRLWSGLYSKPNTLERRRIRQFPPVAASTAGSFAYRIGDHPYIDGGYRTNAENADLAAGYERVLVISSLFHLRRIGQVFEAPFAQEGITVLLHGAPSDQFDEARWWQYEEGLIMLNNEYVKLLYYAWRY